MDFDLAITTRATMIDLRTATHLAEALPTTISITMTRGCPTRDSAAESVSAIDRMEFEIKIDLAGRLRAAAGPRGIARFVREAVERELAGRTNQPETTNSSTSSAST